MSPRRHDYDTTYTATPTPVKGPCKACTDFKAWAKTQKDATQSDAVDDCPMDRGELGRSTWGFLHTMAAYYPDRASPEQQCEMRYFIRTLSHFYPCSDCATHLQEDMKNFPPKVGGANELSKWFCDIHNRVNVRLGKPIFDCSRVMERWRDGWADGSCEGGSDLQ